METMSSNVHPVKSKIQAFFEGKTILVTGGTGFLGKVLIEKLLRSCPDIKQIFLLVREKRGVSAEERIKKLLDCEAFSRLKNDHPGFAQKLIVVPGDLSLPQLGLSPENVTNVSENVEIVFHSAATLRFDERLSVAINTNLSATKKLCLLAQKMVNLQAFIYVSTAYCDCDKPLVEEKVPISRIPPETLMDLPQLLGDQTLDEVTPVLLGSKPNTYIFTKCAAEEVVAQFKTSLPVAVFRPSIVLSGESEPLPGWIDNVLGPTGMTASLLAGLVRTALFKPELKANFVPVDYVVNGIIALAYSVGQGKREPSENLQIVNFVSTANNTITWGRFGDLLQAYTWENPSSKLVWYPFGIRAKYQWSYAIMKRMLHTIPANIIDWLAAKIGKPTRLKEYYRKMDKYTSVTLHFTLTEFNFEEGNAEKLWRSLEHVDQQIFPFNMATLDWNMYLLNYVRGCRRFLLREDPNTITFSRKRVKILYIIHLMASSTVFLMFLKVMMFVWRLLRRKENAPMN